MAAGLRGISASIYAARAGLKVTVIGKDNSALIRAGKIENYYGFATPITGKALFDAGVEQAKSLGVEIIKDEVVSIGYKENLVVQTLDKEYGCKSLIIATGSSRKAPSIRGIGAFEGRGISYCAVCDAFFYRGKDVAVVGCCDYALHEAKELAQIARSVKILTNGAKPIDAIASQFTVIEEEIEEFEGDEVLELVRFADGGTIPIDGVFIAIGVAGSSDLSRKIGVRTDGTKILTNENMATNIPGIFAAGDCTGGMLQIAKAVYEGAKAGQEAVKYVRSIK